jgi:hypothetical protein
MTAKPESSKFNYFWMPDQVRHDGFGTFYEGISFSRCYKKSEPAENQTIDNH